jgi:hypothetical protein
VDGIPEKEEYELQSFEKDHRLRVVGNYDRRRRRLWRQFNNECAGLAMAESRVKT